MQLETFRSDRSAAWKSVFISALTRVEQEDLFSRASVFVLDGRCSEQKAEAETVRTLVLVCVTAHSLDYLL